MDSLEVEQWGDIARETSYCCPAASDSNTGAIRGRATVEVLASNADGVLSSCSCYRCVCASAPDKVRQPGW